MCSDGSMPPRNYRAECACLYLGVQVIAMQDMRIRELQTALEVERQLREHQVAAEKEETAHLRTRLEQMTRENIHMHMRYQN